MGVPIENSPYPIALIHPAPGRRDSLSGNFTGRSADTVNSNYDLAVSR